MFKFAKLVEDAVLPRRTNATDAGMDISSCEDVVVPSGNKVAVSTGIAVAFPCDCYARVAPRSGLAFKHAIDVLAGVIDFSYSDQIKVILFNHGKDDFVVSKGDRIAQLIFERIHVPSHDQIEEISYDAFLGHTAASSAAPRGLNGFGSSGLL